MAAAEHQSPGAVEGIEQRQSLGLQTGGQQVRDDEEQRKATRPIAPAVGTREGEKPGLLLRRQPAEHEAGEGTERDGPDLTDRPATNTVRNSAATAMRRAAIRRQRAGHAPDRLRDHRDGDRLSRGSRPRHRAGQGAGAGGEGQKQQGGRAG